jgi:general secretion pathway protein I
LSRSEDPERGRAAGFTLIEALAALGVMAAGLAAVGALANSSLRAELYVEGHLIEIETARMIMTGLPGRAALPFGRLTGSLDSHRWRIDSTPVSATVKGDTSLWTPQGIALLVRSPSGATVEIDTIRLGRRPTK